MADLIARGAGIDDHGDPVANPRPSVIVTIPLKDLASQLGVGEVQGATVGLPAGAVRRLACEADIIPAVLGTESEVLDLGRRYRVASPAQRTALALQYGTCAFGWCDTPFGRTQIHHLTHLGRRQDPPTSKTVGPETAAVVTTKVHDKGWTHHPQR